MATIRYNGDDIIRVEGQGDQLYKLSESGITKLSADSLVGWDRSSPSDYQVASSSDVENLFKNITSAGADVYSSNYINETGIGQSNVTQANASTYGSTAQPVSGYENTFHPNTKAVASAPITSSQYPAAGQTSGDLFTNPNTGVTYNWRTGAIVNDPEGKGAALLPAKAPTTAGGITTGIGNVNLSTKSPGFGDPGSAIASSTGMGTYLDTLMKQNADFAKQQADLEKSRNAESQSMLSKLMSGTKSPAEARSSAWSETGITPQNYFAEEKAKIAEIGKLTEEYNATKAAMEQQIAGSYDKMATNNFINNQQAQITRNAAPKLNMLSANINSKTAVLQALQGRFAEAREFVNQAVQDATADYKYKMDIFQTFYQMNQDSFSRLDKVYQSAFQNSMSLAQTAYEQQYKEKSIIGEMMIDPNLRGAGILITDTLAEAYRKAGIVSGSNYLADRAKTGTGGGGGSTGFLDSKVESNVREDAVSYLADVRAKKMTIEEAYNEMRTLYSPREASDGALKSLLGIAAPVEATTPATTTQTTNQNGTTRFTPESSMFGGIVDGIKNFFKF